MTTNPPNAPVMADVAKVAGVSHQTVSRVINGMPNIKDSTRKRVEAAIKELGLLSNEAIQMGDCDAIARAVGCRYLAFGTVKVGKTDTGFSPVGAAVSSASGLLGARAPAVRSIPSPPLPLTGSTAARGRWLRAMLALTSRGAS